jgi:hypothetical protein
MKYKISADLSVRKIENEIFVLNRKNSNLHSFNKTGAFLWEMAQQGKNADEMLKALTDKYDVSIETAQKDVGDFFVLLQTNGLVEDQ